MKYMLPVLLSVEITKQKPVYDKDLYCIFRQGVLVDNGRRRSEDNFKMHQNIF